jgi:hypothetical protein
LLFDRDFPGHYFRFIKAIAISIPAVVGPYQSVKATLTQTGHKTLLEPDITGVQYLLEGGSEVPSSIRADWRVNQQIAISTGIDDSGVIDFNFNDERYLPFEGTGVVSTWLLELPKATNPIDFDSITDVIINLRYMSKVDNGSFKEAVMKLDAFKTYRGNRLFSLAHEFAAQWFAFRNTNSVQTLELSLPSNLFPPNVTVDISDPAKVAVSQIYSVTAAGELDEISQQFEVELPTSTEPPYSMVLTLKKGNFSKAKVANLLLLLSYEGELRR